MGSIESQVILKNQEAAGRTLRRAARPHKQPSALRGSSSTKKLHDLIGAQDDRPSVGFPAHTECAPGSAHLCP
jgi:hypothetical protein